MNIVAGWGNRTLCFPSLEAAIKRFPEVFSGWGMNLESLQEREVEVERAWVEEDGEEVFRVKQPITLQVARTMVELVNEEGNFDEFVFRPAWPDESPNTPEQIGKSMTDRLDDAAKKEA